MHTYRRLYISSLPSAQRVLTNHLLKGRALHADRPTTHTNTNSSITCYNLCALSAGAYFKPLNDAQTRTSPTACVLVRSFVCFTQKPRASWIGLLLWRYHTKRRFAYTTKPKVVRLAAAASNGARPANLLRAAPV